MESTEQERREVEPDAVAQHQYLGPNMEEHHGRTLFEEGSVLSLPILMHLDIVFVPGEVLPLFCLDEATNTILLEAIEKGGIFGVVYGGSALNNNIRGGRRAKYLTGTTAEIFGLNTGRNNELALKARGRQRFWLLEPPHVRSAFIGKVKILPEIDFGYPLREVQLAGLNRYRAGSWHWDSKRKWLGTKDAASVAVPHWVLKLYNSKWLCKALRDDYALLDTTGNNNKWISKLDQQLTDPLQYSYWVMKNLPLDNEARLKMLESSSAIERLHLAKECLKLTVIECRRCHLHLGDREDAFSMSVEGPSGVYCNPGGRVHAILTIRRGVNLTREDRNPDPSFSWFPGYGWTIIFCGGCKYHVGWKFTALEHMEPTKPREFIGLTQSSIIMSSTIKITPAIAHLHDHYHHIRIVDGIPEPIESEFLGYFEDMGDSD